MVLTAKHLNEVYRLGMHYESHCTGCAQSTVAALLEVLDLENNDVFRSASGLADGIGLTSNGSCGVLTGGALVIGLLFGRDMDDFTDPLAPMLSYDLARKLHDFFLDQYGSSRCADIQEKIMGRSFDFRNPEDAEAAIGGGMLDHCSRVVGDGSRKTLEIIMAHYIRQ